VRARETLLGRRCQLPVKHGIIGVGSTVVLDELRHPLVLAPLAGGPSTPALTAAVSEAGGLGFLAAGYRTADDMRADIRAVREETRAPFGVNLFVLRPSDVADDAVRAYVDRLREEATRYDTEPGEPLFEDDDWDAKLTVLADDPVPVVSFTFGCPPAEAIASLQRLGTEVWVTVTSPTEARVARDAGADALVLQGVEAGGHRASFTDENGEGLSVLALLRLASATVDLPLVAAGGIAEGAAVAAVLAAGASAAQVGTAFLRAPEAGTNPAHQAALATETPTALTRAFTGRLARGLVNRFLREHSEDAPSAYPHIHHVTAPIRATARKRGDADGFNLWAGQTHVLARELPAAKIVATLAEDARAALEDATSRLGGTPDRRTH
jgi:nitronate monooxygenase